MTVGAVNGCCVDLNDHWGAILPVGGRLVAPERFAVDLASYAHLRPQGIRVAVGEHVTRGQVLAQLGQLGQLDGAARR